MSRRKLIGYTRLRKLDFIERKPFKTSSFVTVNNELMTSFRNLIPDQILMLLEDGQVGSLVDDPRVDGVRHGEVDELAVSEQETR